MALSIYAGDTLVLRHVRHLYWVITLARRTILWVGVLPVALQ